MKTLKLLFLLLLLSGCAAVPERLRAPEISISGIELLDLGLFEQKFAINLRLQNPNDFDIRLDGMNYQVELEGEAFAHGVARADQLIPRLGEAVIRTEAISTLQGVARQLLAINRGQQKTVHYRITGEFLVHGGRHYPFDVSGEIGIPALQSPRAGDAAPPR